MHKKSLPMTNLREHPILFKTLDANRMIYIVLFYIWICFVVFLFIGWNHVSKNSWYFLEKHDPQLKMMYRNNMGYMYDKLNKLKKSNILNDKELKKCALLINSFKIIIISIISFFLIMVILKFTFGL